MRKFPYAIPQNVDKFSIFYPNKFRLLFSKYFNKLESIGGNCNSKNVSLNNVFHFMSTYILYDTYLKFYSCADLRREEIKHKL